jgi:type I restriction enzyme S subunit
MTYIEKLLEACPELAEGKVEWKTLGEVGELVRGNGLPKTDFTETGVPAIHYGQIYTYYGAYTEETISFVSPETAKKLKKVNTGDVIITNTSENLEDVGKSVVYLGKQTAVTGGHATIFKPSNSIIGKFFVYYTQTAMFFKKKRKYAKGAKVIDVSAKDLSKITIPIPPLSVQQEIVRILDKFTQLTAELTVELTARKKQYAYYRDELLSFKEGEVEWKTLGEVGTFTYGHVAKAQNSGNARFVRISDINDDGKLKKIDIKYVDLSNENDKFILKKNDLLMARTGATYGKTMIFEEDYLAIYAGFLIKLTLDDNLIIPKYYWHFSQSDLFWNQANKLVSGGGQPQFNANALKQVKIPIPSLSEQSRIVGILDKFDTLCSSISEGLPKEIELRQKQYEYYREKLLNFE